MSICKGCSLHVRNVFNQLFLKRGYTSSSSNHEFITESETSFTEPEETAKFDKTDFDWWDISGPMKPLHTMNSVRVPFIRNCLLYTGIGEGKPCTDKPLEGIDLLEVGCGSGILSEPLCRLGANVTSIDAAENAIKAAKLHRSESGDLENLQYLNAHLEDVVTVGSLKFDAVVASEVIEHVTEPKKFINYCSNLLRPGGSLFITTINRNMLSYALAVFAAEKLLKVVDDGTHDWNKFITTEEMGNYIDQSGCSIRKIHGLMYNPFWNSWSFVDSTDVNYILHAIKLETKEINPETSELDY